MALPYSHQKPDPIARNGNPWSYVIQHGILSQYDPIGIDSRGMSNFMDDFGNRQEAVLDRDGSFEHGYLREGGWYHADNPYEHIVNTAEDFGRWFWVEPKYVEIIEEWGIGDIQPARRPSIRPSGEAKKRWNERGNPDIDIMDAWKNSEKIKWPRKNDSASARYHYETGCTFLREADKLLTVYPAPHKMDEKWLAEEILAQIQSKEEV